MAISFATLLIALESTHVSKCCSGIEDAYNYFTSGFVCTVDLRNTSEFVILKALVNPSMRNPENAWVAIKKSGDIVAAHWEREEGE